ncbi:MAG: 2Fe-2S iron-sulfur cluster-binding protein [Lentimicrobiaceae bacterium]|nr:2Fe-2S iron-sulfur cluster-binding protein [Lentimicrobiaceae bacterium]
MKIKINNKEYETLESEKLIEVAQRNGIEIPTLCYAKGLKHQASCMVCVVKDCNTGQFIPSCDTLITNGMNIDTESDEVRELQKQSLELLLSDHIAVCRPPCKPENCKLRKYALAYHAKWNTFQRYSAIKKTQSQHIKDNLWFDVNKCIRCGLCVYNSHDGFTFKERGFNMQVILPVESINNVNELLCEICPTQALFFIIL